jgi:Domain of Unknown Function (DUF1259)
MKREIMATVLAMLMMFWKSSLAQDIGIDTKKVEEIAGVKGALNSEEKVFKVSFPRTDVKVSVDDWTMKPFMGLTSWAAFTRGTGSHTMVMGDLVVFEDEVNPVMSAALDNGLEVTALHNHFFFDQPNVYFMHIGGHGSVEMLAKAVRMTQDKIKEIRASSPEPKKGFQGTPIPAENSIDGKTIDQLLGQSGQANAGMYKVVVGRRAKHNGTAVGKEMGVNTWAAFAGSNENAFLDGDFAVLEDELQPVLKTLRGAGVNIVAIHHHMTHEQPRYIFLHYWGRGSTVDLAKAVRTALDRTRPYKEAKHWREVP